jgi:hypothetical protein
MLPEFEKLEAVFMQNVWTVDARGPIGRRARGRFGRFYVRMLLHRFRTFIETTDWDRKPLLNEGLDRLCLYLLGAAMTGFLIPTALTVAK